MIINRIFAHLSILKFRCFPSRRLGYSTFALLTLTLLLLTNSGGMDLRPQLAETRPKDSPLQFSLYSQKNSGNEPWWHEFGREELNRLQTVRLQDSPDLELFLKK